MQGRDRQGGDRRRTAGHGGRKGPAGKGPAENRRARRQEGTDREGTGGEGTDSEGTGGEPPGTAAFGGRVICLSCLFAH